MSPNQLYQKRPEITVVMPAYNSRGTIERSLQSVVSQTFPNWELIVVDDNSSDKTLDTIQKYTISDSRINVYSLPKRRGPAFARNFAMKKALGDFIAFLDSDDIWLPKKIEKQIPFLRSDQFPIVFSWYNVVSVDNTIMHQRRCQEKSDYESLLSLNRIGNLTAVYNRKKYGRIYQDYVNHEDYAYWLKILRKTGKSAYCLQEPLANYTVSSKSLSGNKVKCAYWTFSIYNNCEDFGMLASLYLLIRHLIHQLFIR
jgi:glycosyltransferase involved in cell wall biosynthesis